jgi:hypothetical protein
MLPRGIGGELFGEIERFFWIAPGPGSGEIVQQLIASLTGRESFGVIGRAFAIGNGPTTGKALNGGISLLAFGQLFGPFDGGFDIALGPTVCQVADQRNLVLPGRKNFYEVCRCLRGFRAHSPKGLMDDIALNGWVGDFLQPLKSSARIGVGPGASDIGESLIFSWPGGQGQGVIRRRFWIDLPPTRQCSGNGFSSSERVG